MYYVPKHQNYLGGETIMNALSGTLLPRFLFPNKVKGSDSRDVFEKVTGFTLLDNTSMGLSVVGEFYVNYGVKGAWAGLFIYGMFISLALRLLSSYFKFSPFVVLWFVLIFFQVIKAETYFLKVMNHFVKASMFTVFVYTFLQSIGIEIFPVQKAKESLYSRKINS